MNIKLYLQIACLNTPEPIKPTIRGYYNLLNKRITYGFKNRDIFTAIDFERNSYCIATKVEKIKTKFLGVY